MAAKQQHRYSDCTRFLILRLNGQIYGVPVSTVIEVNKPRSISPLPKAPPFVLGMMLLRDIVIPVVSLRTKLGIPSVKNTRQTSVISIEGGSQNFGVLVDSVDRVMTINKDQISPPLFSKTEEDSGYIIGLGLGANNKDKGVIILLDTQALFSNRNFAKQFDINKIQKELTSNGRAA